MNDDGAGTKRQWRQGSNERIGRSGLLVCGMLLEPILLGVSRPKMDARASGTPWLT
jgi:hypothetical protein